MKKKYDFNIMSLIDSGKGRKLKNNSQNFKLYREKVGNHKNLDQNVIKFERPINLDSSKNIQCCAITVRNGLQCTNVVSEDKKINFIEHIYLNFLNNNNTTNNNTIVPNEIVNFFKRNTFCHFHIQFPPTFFLKTNNSSRNKLFVFPQNYIHTSPIFQIDQDISDFTTETVSGVNFLEYACSILFKFYKENNINIGFSNIKIDYDKNGNITNITNLKRYCYVRYNNAYAIKDLICVQLLFNNNRCFNCTLFFLIDVSSSKECNFFYFDTTEIDKSNLIFHYGNDYIDFSDNFIHTIKMIILSIYIKSINPLSSLKFIDVKTEKSIHVHLAILFYLTDIINPSHEDNIFRRSATTILEILDYHWGDNNILNSLNARNENQNNTNNQSDIEADHQHDNSNDFDSLINNINVIDNFTENINVKLKKKICKFLIYKKPNLRDVRKIRPAKKDFSRHVNVKVINLAGSNFLNINNILEEYKYKCFDYPVTENNVLKRKIYRECPYNDRDFNNNNLQSV